MKRHAAAVVLVAAMFIALAARLEAAPQDLTMKLDGIGSVSAPLQIVLVLTLLSFLPAVLVIMTSFTRIVIVLHFLRQAIGSQDMPPNQVIVGLTLFLTAFIMAPVAERINDRAVQPVLAGSLSIGDGITAATPPLREFMLKHTRQTDLALFVEISKTPRPSTAADLPMLVVIPVRHLGAQDRLSDGVLRLRAVSPHRPRRLDDAAVDGHVALPPAMIRCRSLLLFVMVDGWNHRYLGRGVSREGGTARPLRRSARLTHSWWALSGRPSNWLCSCRCPCCWPARGRHSGEHVPDGHVDSGQRPGVHSASRGHLRGLRADLPWMLRAERFHAAALARLPSSSGDRFQPPCGWHPPVRPGVLRDVAGLHGAFAPARVKVGLIVLIAIALAPSAAVPLSIEPLPIALVLAREAAIGFALALALRVLIAGAEAAGSLIGFQMYLSYGATIDPQSGVRNPILSVLYSNIALITFLSIDGHHAFLRTHQLGLALGVLGTADIGPPPPSVRHDHDVPRGIQECRHHGGGEDDVGVGK